MSMDKTKELYSGKKIVILGLAKSGVAIAKIMKNAGATVVVNDRKPEEECQGVAELRGLGIPVICGSHPDDLIDASIDLLIKNPGIPYGISPIEKALELGIPVVTEVEIAYQISPAPIIGITGSNGKTTTTTLVGLILEEGGRSPVVAGNIGTVLSEQAVNIQSKQVFVAELSSFQLKGTQTFRPWIGCLLNVYNAHLDYHKTKEDYVHSKRNLFVNQTAEDIAVFNYDNSYCRDMAEGLKSKVLWFSLTQEVEQGSFLKEGKICFRHALDGEIEEIIPIENIALPGEHNLENVLAAVTITRAAGVSSQVIQQVLTTFTGVEHRLEFVGEVDGVKYYNDSKATNPEAASRAIRSFKQPIVLIAGGLDRGIDFKELIPHFQNRVKTLLTYGQTAEILLKRGEDAGIKNLIRVDNVNDAVAKAHQVAEGGEVVLLSPACASWDMYTSFEERGSMFKQSVHKLKTSP